MNHKAQAQAECIRHLSDIQCNHFYNDAVFTKFYETHKFCNPVKIGLNAADEILNAANEQLLNNIIFSKTQKSLYNGSQY